MPHREFQPRTAIREEKRQAAEALGRSFCKSLAEPITNSDSSAKRKLKVPQSSGLVDLMLKVPKGTQLDTAALRASLAGKQPKRVIVVELATTRQSGRPPGEIVIIDQAEGMSADTLQAALDEIGGDKINLSKGIVGRNLFGRGLSDVMRAHTDAVIQTFDGNQLTIASGAWDGRWTIKMDFFDGDQAKGKLKLTSLDPATSGTAIRFVIADRKRCHIPDPSDIVFRLGNFSMLRLIASDPNVELILRQYRAAGLIQQSITYDFPVGQVVDSFAREFTPTTTDLDLPALKLDFLVARCSESQRPLRGPGLDPDGRENGMLLVDELDAVYDLTFADPDYEKADFLATIFGVVRINGLRQILEAYLNADSPSSPLRTDRGGFNRDHPFAKALLEFIADELRPIYEKERKRLEEKAQGGLSSESKKRIDDALKQLNKYFEKITELGGEGSGPGDPAVKAPTQPVAFFPEQTKLTAGRSRQVLLLVREDAVESRAEIVATATDGITVQPETEEISKKESPRWPPHKEFFALRFAVTSSVIGQQGKVTAVVEGKDGKLLEAELRIDDVLPEPIIEIPETLEFRPQTATGRPGRRNNLILFVNPIAVPAGQWVNLEITDRTGNVMLVEANGTGCEKLDVKLELEKHKLKGQNVFRLPIQWTGTAWNQRARVIARAKGLMTHGWIRLDEPEDGGFFKDVRYEEIDPKAPSQFAAGVITVNTCDPLNRQIFGNSKEEFDKRLSTRPEAQQRLASLLVEEASFRALQQLHDDNKLLLAERREVAAVHEQVDKYKFESAVEVYRALTKIRS